MINSVAGINRIGRISWSVVIFLGSRNVIRRVLQVPSVKRLNHAQKKRMYFETIRQRVPQTSGSISGEFEIVSVE